MVRAQKKSKPARGAHFLNRTEVKTDQDTEQKKASEWRSLPEGGRGQK